jgi:hypothetical protein
VKDTVTDFAALAGFGCIVGGAFLIATPLGLAVLGVSLLLIAYGLTRTEANDQSSR